MFNKHTWDSLPSCGWDYILRASPPCLHQLVPALSFLKRSAIPNVCFWVQATTCSPGSNTSLSSRRSLSSSPRFPCQISTHCAVVHFPASLVLLDGAASHAPGSPDPEMQSSQAVGSLLFHNSTPCHTTCHNLPPLPPALCTAQAGRHISEHGAPVLEPAFCFPLLSR